MKIHKNDSALVVIDPQNDVLSKTGVSWPLVAAKFSDAERHLRRLSKVASLKDDPPFGISERFNAC